MKKPSFAQVVMFVLSTCLVVAIPLALWLRHEEKKAREALWQVEREWFENNCGRPLAIIRQSDGDWLQFRCDGKERWLLAPHGMFNCDK